MNAMGTAVEQLHNYFSQVVEERAGIPISQEREDLIVYTLYGSQGYATGASGASRRLNESGFMLGRVVTRRGFYRFMMKFR